MEITRQKTQMSLPELALLAGTRVLVGGGLGLLLSQRLESRSRKAIGWSLFLVGALSTIPLALDIFGEHRRLQIGG